MLMLSGEMLLNAGFTCFTFNLREWIVTLAIQWESQAASERSPVSGLIKSQI